MFVRSINSLVNPMIAYLDPGTGSYMFQILVAAVFGVTVTIKAHWHKIGARFRKGDNRKLNG